MNHRYNIEIWPGGDYKRAKVISVDANNRTQAAAIARRENPGAEVAWVNMVG